MNDIILGLIILSVILFVIFIDWIYVKYMSVRAGIAGGGKSKKIKYLK